MLYDYQNEDLELLTNLERNVEALTDNSRLKAAFKGFFEIAQHNITTGEFTSVTSNINKWKYESFHAKQDIEALKNDLRYVAEFHQWYTCPSANKQPINIFLQGRLRRAQRIIDSFTFSWKSKEM